MLLCSNNLVFATKKLRSNRNSLALATTQIPVKTFNYDSKKSENNTNNYTTHQTFAPCVNEQKKLFNETQHEQTTPLTPTKDVVATYEDSLKEMANSFAPRLKTIIRKHYKKSFSLTKEEIKNCSLVTLEEDLAQKATAFVPKWKELLTQWKKNRVPDFSKVLLPPTHDSNRKPDEQIITEPSPESQPGTPRTDFSENLRDYDKYPSEEVTNHSEKGKEKENEDDFIVVDSEQNNSLWTKEDLAQLPEIPFGQFLKAELEARNKQLITPSMHKERDLNLVNLANISMTSSFIEDLTELGKKNTSQVRTIDLSGIDDEEWGIIDALPEPKFLDYHWKSKMINADKKENGVIAFFLIHGTFVDHNEFGKDNQTKMTQDLVNAAKRLALDKNCAVKLISFQWSGELSPSSRKEGANILKRFFTSDEDCMQAHMITAFSHSFGGDVLLQFADLLKPYNKTLDWAVMAGTPLGESTKLEPVSKKPRIIEPADSEQCFNIKKVFQFFSRGDITQAAGSRQMTLNLLNPLGTAERRLPLRINRDCDRTVVNCHVEHNGDLCSHVNIKWHVAAALHLILPMIEDCYPYAHDLNVATCNDNKAHLPIITLRNRIFSSNCIEKNNRSLLASELGKELFNKLYKKPIGKQNNWTATKAYYEVTHAGYSQNDQGREDLAKLFEN